MEHVEERSTWPSIHRPSRMPRVGTPLSAAFMPLVPEASFGGCGRSSRTSAPAVSARAISTS